MEQGPDSADPEVRAAVPPAAGFEPDDRSRKVAASESIAPLAKPGRRGAGRPESGAAGNRSAPAAVARIVIGRVEVRVVHQPATVRRRRPPAAAPTGTELRGATQWGRFGLIP